MMRSNVSKIFGAKSLPRLGKKMKIKKAKSSSIQSAQGPYKGKKKISSY